MAAWAQRYDPAFEQAMRFLDESKKEHAARIKADTRRRRWTFGGIVFGLIVAITLALWAFGESRTADDQRRIAESNAERALNQGRLARYQQRLAVAAGDVAAAKQKQAVYSDSLARESAAEADNLRRIAYRRAEETRTFATLVAAEANPDPLVKVLLLGAMKDAPEPAGGLHAARQVADTPFPRTVLRGPGGGVRSAAFNAAGDRIVTASEDGTARIWQASWPALLAFLREATIACLTDEQRTRYLGEAPAEARAAYAACELDHGRPAPPDE